MRKRGSRRTAGPQIPSTSGNRSTTYIEERDQIGIAAGQVLDAEVDRLEQKGDPDRQQHAAQLAAAVEFARQQAGKRDHDKAEDRQRHQKALMALDDEAAPQHRFQLRRRPEQLVEKPLLGFAEAARRARRAAGSDRACSGRRSGRTACRWRGRSCCRLPFTMTIREICRVIGEGAALGHDRDRLLRIAIVVDQQAGDLAALVAAADIDRQLARDRRERALLQQRRDEAVADLELQILERRGSRPAGNRPTG